jgi:hypothetical protein
MLPLRNGELPSKPPFFHWIAALTALVFGLNDFVVRLPSAIGAEVMAITTFLIGRAVGDRKTAWLAVGALLGMYEFWDSGTQARVDMVFSACVVVSISGFFFWYRDGQKLARAACYIASACAVLAKGPAGLALPALVICGFLAVEGRVQLLWKFWSWPLAGLVFLINVGWYGLAYQIGGNEFLVLHIFDENLDRFLGTNGFSNKSTHLSTAIWLATRTLPWNLMLLWCLIRRVCGEREDSDGRFLHTWWMSVFSVFGFAASGRAVYLLPMYPAIALLAARAIVSLLTSLEKPSVQKAPSPGSGSHRPLQMAKRVGISVAFFDLALMLVNHNAWRDVQQRKTRLTFIEKIAATVPTYEPLLATPEFDNTDLIVIAYRLKRKIDRRPMAPAERNDYFLSRSEPVDFVGAKTRVLASSEMHKVALLTVVAGTSAVKAEATSRLSANHSP